MCQSECVFCGNESVEYVGESVLKSQRFCISMKLSFVCL